MLAPFATRTPTTRAAGPVRVSFVIDDLSRAGTEIQLLALIRALDRDRVRPSLVLLNGTGPESRELEPTGCPLLRLGVRKLASAAGLRAAHALRNFWQAERPDVVQAYFLDSAYLAVPVARLCGVRRVVRVRNNLGYWLTAKHRLLGRLISPGVDVTLTNSAAGADALRDRERLAPGRVRVIENGVDLERFAGFDPPGSNFPQVRIGCVANLRPVKNLDGLLRAAKQVCAALPHATFAVAGDGPERGRLERLRDQLGLEERFRFVGPVADVPGFLRSVDVAVLPSHSESLSNALLEYLAAGRATVATAVGAAGELIEPGVNGELVPPGDDEALADVLTRVAGDPGRMRAMGQAARGGVARTHGRAAMARRFEGFYEGLRRQPA